MPLYGHSQEYVVLANHDFEFYGSFKLVSKDLASNYCYIYTGYIDYSWIIGIDENLQLVFWMGDGKSWLNCYPLNVFIEIEQHYLFYWRRTGSYFIFEINREIVCQILLPSSVLLLGSLLGIGALQGKSTLWLIEIELPRVAIKDLKYQNQEASFRQRVHLLSVFYGEKYSNLISSTLFPSLLLSSNLPAMKDKKITHHIYCTEEELPLLNYHIRNLQELDIEVNIDTTKIPNVQNKRDYLYLAFVDAIEKAIAEDAIVVMAQADHVFGHGLANIINEMQPFEFVVCGHPRVNENAAAKFYPQFLKEQLSMKNQSNLEFVSTALNQLIHPLVKTGLNSMEPYWHAFVNNDNISVFFKEPPPLCFHPSIDLICIMLGTNVYGRFETIDHEMTDYSFQKKRLRVIDDSTKFFWTEMTDEATYNPTISNNYWSSAAKRLFHHELNWYFK